MAKKILLIEDEYAITAALTVRLRANGYDVRAAGDGAAGLAAAAQYRPDAILLDIRMPDMDGFTVCRRLKSDPQLAGVPVIFLSANVQDPAQQMALEAGGAAFIAKPFEAGHVLATIEAAIASPPITR